MPMVLTTQRRKPSRSEARGRARSAGMSGPLTEDVCPGAYLRFEAQD